MNKKFLLVMLLLITTFCILSAVNAEDVSNTTKTVKPVEKKEVVTTQNIKTDKKPVTVTAKDIETKATYVNLSAKVTDGNTKVNDGYLIYKLNGKTLLDSKNQTIMTPVKNGESSYLHKLKPGMSAKNYTITYAFLKSNTYNRTEQKAKIILLKSNINTNLKDVTVAQGQNLTLSSKFVDEFGQDLNRVTKMAIKISGKTNQIFNITNGNFQTTLKTDTLRKGDYKLTVIAGENNAHKENRTNIILKITNFDKYVSATGKGQKTGNNWENAQPILDAINQLNKNTDHTIANFYLDEGTYNLGNTGKKYAIQVQGSKNLKTLNFLGKGIDKTILNGNGKSGIIFINNPNTRLNVKGMTLTQGNATLGGGIYSLASTTTLNTIKFTNNKAIKGAGYASFITGDSNITASNCVFVNNYASIEGGATYVNSSTGKHQILLHKINGINNHAQNGGVLSISTSCPTNVILSKSTMTNNNAKDGGVIFSHAYTGNVQLTLNNKNQFNNNWATDTGGVINVISNYGDTYLNIYGKNVFTNNYAKNAGGCIYNRANSKNILISVDSNTFKNNSAFLGGSIFNQGKLNTTIKVNNTKFSADKAINGNGGSIWTQGNYAITNISNSLIENDQAIKGNGSGVCTLAILDAIVNVYNTTFSNNQAYLGGGLYTWSNLTDAIVTVTASNFVNNNAEKEGAAIYTTTDLKTVRLYLNYVYFDNNHGKGMGGTIYNRADLGSIVNTVYNSKIYHSSSYENGSAICNRATIDLSFESRNSEFKDCKTYNQGRGTIYNYATNNIKANLIDTVIQDNNSTIGAAISNIAQNKLDFNITSSKILNNKVTDHAPINAWATKNDVNFNIKDSTISNNNGGSKATIYTYSAGRNILMTVTNSIFNNNQGTTGGVFSNAAPKGSIATALNKNTFTNNRATNGPAMFNIAEKGKITQTVTNSQITNNKATDKGAFVNSASNIVVRHNYNKILGNTANKGSYLWNSRIPSTCNIESNSWGNNPDWSKLLFATPKPTKWSV